MKVLVLLYYIAKGASRLAAQQDQQPGEGPDDGATEEDLLQACQGIQGES